MGVVVLCPGQGQVPRELGALVEASGEDLAAAYADRLGPDALADPLADFARQQAALVAVGIGRGRRSLAWLNEPEHLAEHGPVIAFAGHSLGELTALALSGALDGPSAVRLAADRGAALEVHREPFWDDAGMLAISGPTVHDEIAGLLERHGAELGNDNAGDQVVVTGMNVNLVATADDARERGLRAVRLETTGPSHSSFMKPVVPTLRAAVEATAFNEPSVPVYSGLTAAPFTDPATELSEMIAGQVRWRETLLALGALEPTLFFDAGPAKAMARLARKSVPDVPTLTLDELEVAR